jgi:hypothetical protein
MVWGGCRKMQPHNHHSILQRFIIPPLLGGEPAIGASGPKTFQGLPPFLAVFTGCHSKAQHNQWRNLSTKYGCTRTASASKQRHRAQAVEFAAGCLWDPDGPTVLQDQANSPAGQVGTACLEYDLEAKTLTQQLQ